MVLLQPCGTSMNSLISPRDLKTTYMDEASTILYLYLKSWITLSRDIYMHKPF